MHEMAEKCATAIKNECAPKQNNKKAQTKWMETQHTQHTENREPSVQLCGEVRKGNYNAKITYSHLP